MGNEGSQSKRSIGAKRWAVVGAAVVCLFLIYVFQRTNTAGFLLASFSPSPNLIFIINKTIRLVLNDLCCFAIIWAVFQEKKYLQFAILPSDSWKQKNGQPYIENKIRTHEAIAQRLLEVGSYSDINVDVKVIFRGTNSSVEGSFKINQSSGVEQLEAIIAREENAKLSEIKLPKAGMLNTDLQNQALTIMRNKSKGSGKTYTKAIITSVNWDYDKTYAGVTVSRSLVIALASKEHDVKCMYQYFNFKQQAQGNGKFNSNLELAGAGDNEYISCDNAN